MTRKVLADAETPLSAYRKLADSRPGTFLLESAENGRSWSRWSFIGAGAPSALTVRDGQAVWLGEAPHDAPTGGDPLRALHETLELLATGALPGLPPLSGGMVGFFAYDLVRRLERLPEIAVDDLNLPDIAELWRRGSVIASWLLDLQAAALIEDPNLAKFAGRVSDSGEGRWTIKAAIDEGVPAHVLSSALYERFSSRGEADFADKLLSAMRYEFGGHIEKPAGS